MNIDEVMAAPMDDATIIPRLLDQLAMGGFQAAKSVVDEPMTDRDRIRLVHMLLSTMGHKDREKTVLAVQVARASRRN